MGTNFDEIFSAAKQTPDIEAEPELVQPKAVKPKTSPKSKASPSKPDPWANLETEQKEASIRLNVDIPISLNDALTDKARQLRKSKSELIRELLKWALE